MRPSAALFALLLAGSVSGSVMGDGLGPIAEVRAGDTRVELHREPGPCVGTARWAVFIEDKVRVPGCWILVEESVQIAWLDGSASVIPSRAFRKPEIL
jgi:hypothetical protein